MEGCHQEESDEHTGRRQEMGEVLRCSFNDLPSYLICPNYGVNHRSSHSCFVELEAWLIHKNAHNLISEMVGS